MDGGIGRGSVWLVALALAGGCEGDDSGDGAASTTGGVATTSGPSADTDPASTGADSSSGDPAPMGPPVCTKTCIVPGECCPPGAEGCPSSDYPNNWSCVDDLCVPPQCSSDADCGEGVACLTLYGVNTCLSGCASDGDCAALSDVSACMGVADNGQGFCLDPCTEPGVSCGNALCDDETGLCTCSSDTQCAGNDRCV